MTNQKKYVAYVSTYTMGDNHGITIYDVDVENGRFTLKDRVEITNSSYLTISHNRKWLYSITDFGVESYEILKDGHLKPINMAGINGMRGCYLSTDYEDRFLFVAGWHDGKITALRLKEDGSVGEITDEIFHRGLGSIAERNFRPHVSRVKKTRDNHYLCAADLGMDHVKVYRLDHQTGKLTLADVIRSEMESAPRHIKFSRDGRILYKIDQKTGLLTKLFCLPISGEYPKDAMLFPDNRHLVSLNHESNTMTFFTVHPDTGLIVMNGPEIKVDQPNCVIFHRLEEE